MPTNPPLNQPTRQSSRIHDTPDPVVELPIVKGGPTLRQAVKHLNDSRSSTRGHAAKLLSLCGCLEPPKTRSKTYNPVLTKHEDAILHVCTLIITFVEDHEDLAHFDDMIEALITYVPDLRRWSSMLDLLCRVDTDDIHLDEFETISKMLLSSLLLHEEYRRSDYSQAWAGRSSSTQPEFLKQFLDLFNSVKSNDHLAAALIPVVFALEQLPPSTDPTSRATYRNLCGSFIWKLSRCMKPSLFDFIARAVVVCAKAGDGVDAAVTLCDLDIAPKTADRDQHWVARLSALFNYLDLSMDKVGEAALAFALCKNQDDEFCAVEMLCGAGCWSTSTGWLLPLRSKIKGRIGGLKLAQWDSCCMEQMYSHILQKTGDEQEEQATLTETVCGILAGIYEGVDSLPSLGTWCKRGFSFCFSHVDNWLFNEYCICPFVKALPVSHRTFLQRDLRLFLADFCPIRGDQKTEVDRFKIALKGATNPVPQEVKQRKPGIAHGCTNPIPKDKNVVAQVPQKRKQPDSDIAPVTQTKRKDQNLVSHARSTIDKGKIRRVHGHLVCPHNRRKSMCKECNGGSICEHGKQRHWCADCGGGARCDHGKQKSRCKDCGGKGICQHGRLKWRCTLCNKKE